MFPTSIPGRVASCARTKLLLPVLIPLGVACTDAPTANSAPHAREGVDATTAASQASTQRLIADIEQRASDRRLGDDSVTLFTSDGTKETVDLATYAGRLRHGLQGGSAPMVADDGEPLRITGSSFTYFPNNYTMRSGATTISNKTGLVSYEHNSTAMLATGAGLVLRTDKHSETKSVYGGIHTSVWPDYTLSGGCSWRGTITTNHFAKYPGGIIGGPGLITQTDAVASANQASLTTTDCTQFVPDTVRTPSSNPCDDIETCLAPGGGGSAPGGGSSTHEISIATGGSLPRREVTVCLVTDWYVNGEYVETVVDTCWTEYR